VIRYRTQFGGRVPVACATKQARPNDVAHTGDRDDGARPVPIDLPRCRLTRRVPTAAA
jgi:hypothetical protein